MKGIRVSEADKQHILSVYVEEGFAAAWPLADRLGLHRQYINSLARRLGLRSKVQMRGSQTTHGMCGTSEYNIWGHIIDRCENPKAERYADYGARGIAVCEKWRSSFDEFFRDMGPRPSSKHSIDRIDTNGNYEPGNCRWADHLTQQNNRRSNITVFYRGAKMTLAEAFRASGCQVGYSTIRYRLASGWDIERALHDAPKRREVLKQLRKEIRSVA